MSRKQRTSQSNKRKNMVGSFAHLDALQEAVDAACDDRDLELRDVYSPVPVEGLDQKVLPGRSPVRFVTFTGAVSGLVGGFALAILTSMIWGMIVSGKPVTHHVPFVVVGFELTILLGAVSTFLALMLFARLPNRKFPGAAYRPEFSKDRFGIWLACDEAHADRARELLNHAGAEEVHAVGPGSEEGAS